MCSYAMEFYPDPMYCDASDGNIWISLVQKEDSWVKLEFDQAYNLEGLKIRLNYEHVGADSGGGISTVIWIEFSDGEKVLITLTEDSEVWNEVAFRKLVLTSFVKFSIESVTVPDLMISLTGLKIFGCYLSTS